MRNGSWIALCVVIAVTLWIAARPESGPPSVRDRVRSITSELRCVDCQSQSVAVSSTSSARAFRSDIRERVEAGESNAEIRQAYVDTYGEFILLKPASSGIGVLLWALPIIVVLVGGGGLVLLLRRSRRQPRLSATEEDEALVARARDQR